MNLTIFKLRNGLHLFFLVCPVILVFIPKEAQGETGTELGDNDEGFLESEDFHGARAQAQNQDSYILEKLHSCEQKLKGVQEKLNELYAFFPLLQQFKKKRLEQERLKREMMGSPRAKLYTGKNLTGNVEIYDFNSASLGRGCHQLQNYSGRIKSVDTEGTCVRLFQHCHCRYHSQAFYPGMDGNAIDSKLNGVKCIGPCSPNELEDAEIEGFRLELTVHKGENGVPDLIADYYAAYWNNKTFLSPSNSSSITHYNLGAGNRLEGVLANIYPKHLRTPEEAEQLRNAGLSFSSGRFQLDENQEEAGFAIPLELGGVSDQLYNIFPQDKAAAVKYRQAFVPLIKQYLQNYPSSYAFLSLRFLYENPTATKPRGIWYRTVGPISGYIFN